MATSKPPVKVHWFIGNTGAEFTTLVPREEYNKKTTLKDKDDLITEYVQKDFETRVSWIITSVED